MVSKTLWLPVTGYEGLYEVSNRGEVRSLPKEVRDSKGRSYSREGKVLKKARKDALEAVIVKELVKLAGRENHGIDISHGLERLIYSQIAKALVEKYND